MNYSINSFTGASEANLLVQGILFCISETILKTFENISETFWRYGAWNAVLSSVERAVQARARCRDDPDLKKWVFFNGFSLYLGLKMNIFQKMKHESYSTFGELSNAFYRFLKFEFHQELWAKNSEILTLKSGFSFFFGSKINIFQKMKHQSYSTSWELSNAFYRF